MQLTGVAFFSAKDELCSIVASVYDMKWLLVWDDLV
jgi:hypothetical protein